MSKSDEVFISRENEEQLEQYIKEYIELIKKYESLYELEQIINRGDTETAKQILIQIRIMREILRKLIEKNTQKKRVEKQQRKETKAQEETISDRLHKVIYVDLFQRLGISSLKELKVRYNKLSDWIDDTHTYLPQYRINKQMSI